MTKFKITEIYALVGEDTEGEGVWGFNSPNGWIPMIGSDWERLKNLLPIADSIAKATGKTYKILRFSVREDITQRVIKEYKSKIN